jgi:hypothetical protein
MDEKRRDPRFKSDQKLWCEGQDLEAEAVARDMSRGGMAIMTDKASEIGSQVKVSFVTPEEGKMSVNMEVVWHNRKPEGGPAAMGLRVVSFDKGQDAFDRFVARHLDEPGPAAQEAEKGAPAPGPADGKPAPAGAEDEDNKNK